MNTVSFCIVFRRQQRGTWRLEKLVNYLASVSIDARYSFSLPVYRKKPWKTDKNWYNLIQITVLINRLCSRSIYTSKCKEKKKKCEEFLANTIFYLVLEFLVWLWNLIVTVVLRLNISRTMTGKFSLIKTLKKKKKKALKGSLDWIGRLII